MGYMTEIGSTGLERYAGYVYEEFIPDLRFDKGIKLYNQMANNDPVIGAMLFAIRMLIRQVAWGVEPFGDTPADLEAADFLESCLDDMEQTWSDTITEILTFLEFGWSWHEIVYKRRLGVKKDPALTSKHNDGKIGWRKIAGRAQTSWEEWQFGDNGEILGMIQRAAPDFITRTIPIEKSLLFRTTTKKNNPEGVSLLRNAYRPWYFKKHLEQIQGIGVERDLAGLPVAHVPPELLDRNASAANKSLLTAIKKIVTNIRRDEQEGIVFPMALDENGNPSYKLELLSTGGSRQFNIKEILEYYDQRIAITVLADFILLGLGKTGSFALSGNKTKIFTSAISSFVGSIKSTFNKHAVPQLFRLNGMQLEGYPKIQTSEIEDIDLDALGNFIKSLSGAGAELFPDDELENDLRGKAKLPLKNTEEVV